MGENMKKTAVAILFILFYYTAYASGPWYSSVIHEDRLRDFKVFVPSSYRGAPLPLVIVLHGGGGRNTQIEKSTGFSKLAEKQGFIVAYPQGLDRQWNDGRETAQGKAHSLKINDTGFIVKMLGAIREKYRVDKSRIYVCGISNGGFMSMRLACDMSDVFAAAGIVCAGLNPYLAENARPEKKISLLIMNGTEDPLVPYNGGYVKIFKQKRGEVLSTEYSVKYWLAWNGCGGEPFLAMINPDTEDNTEIEKYTYDCRGAEVILYKIIGGGHTWPGGFQYLPENVVGRTSRDINATEVLWNFFKKHRK